jgi:aminoglycoside phosphotransferase (APT) family kinase protein
MTPMNGSVDIEDPKQLMAYLAAHGFDTADAKVRCLEGGVSNKTMYVGLSDGWEIVLKQALVRLRVPTEWLSPPERVHREALGLRWLGNVEPEGSVPRFLFEDFDQHILAMTAVPQPHTNWKDDLMAGVVDTSLFIQAARLLGSIHRLSNRGGIPEAFADTGYFDSLRVEPYYSYAAQQAPEAAPFLAELSREALTRKEGIVHGDFSPKNFLVHAGRLNLLDHEVIHLGDPAFDIGFVMAHFLSKAHHFPQYRNKLMTGVRCFLDTLASEVPLQEWENRAVAHTLGCLLARVAGRSQLGYLSAEEKQRQREVVIALMQNPPRSLPQAADQFDSGIK